MAYDKQNQEHNQQEEEGVATRPAYLLTLSELAGLTGTPEKQLLADIDGQGLVRLGISQFAVLPQQVRDYLITHGVDYRFRTIAHINLKGGVGKTTSTISLATRAAQYGFRTCILDLDSQASASLAFGIVAEDDDPVFIDIWAQPAELLMASLHQIQDELFLLPSSLENALLDIALAKPVQQKQAVRNVCQVLQSRGFDLVFIDCPPSLGAAVISTACAADIIVIPVGFDVFSQKGLELTINEIGAICETFGLAMPQLKILYNFFDRRVKQSVEFWETLGARHGEQLLTTPIRTTTQFSKAVHGQGTVFSSTARSGSKEDFDQCLRQLLDIPTGSAGRDRG